MDKKLTPEERSVLDLLAEKTYDEIVQITGWSRGRIYGLALKTGRRKTENRIAERKAERNTRQAEFLQEILNTTTSADVLDFLDGVPDNSVQLHVTSVPYNLGKKYGECASADLMAYTYFHGWLMQVISETARTLAEGGVVFLNVGKTRDWENSLYPMDIMLFEDLRRSGLTFQNRIIWTVPHGLTPRRGRLADRYETVLVFSKGDTPTFNPNAARVPQKDPTKRAFKGPNKGKLSGNPLGAHPTDVWRDIGNCGHHHKGNYDGTHPAPFPNKLAKRAILLYSLPGDLVCDPFCGSGTTAEAALQTGRAFVGADLFYEDMRTKRLASAVPDLVSPLPGVTDESIAVWQAEARRVDVTAKAISSHYESKQIELAFNF